ncbi:hypothetical protein [Neobacillus dielmonensis]|uniref:hypothetical protein n=1 Tax=Neobacillus dielmonensis TaxID=1347369 RepID=UPI0005A7EDC9|nr:hypothetical protein [Neobacillus dielmonensis]
MGVKKDHHDCCDCKKDCLCRILKKFIHEEISIRTKSGDIIEGELDDVTKDCCIKIIETGITTPFVPTRITVTRCKDVESFTIDLLG